MSPSLHGILYHREMPSNHRSVRLIPKKETFRDKFRKTMGAGLTSISLALFLYSYGPIVSSQLTFTKELPHKSDTPSVTPVLAHEEGESEASIVSNEFTIAIPFLDITSNVIPNVDPSNEANYDSALSEGVAQAKDMGNPGEGKRIFLFAHSTNSPLFIERYNAIFYNLERVPNGEKIEINFHGKTYTYIVTDKKIVNATDTQWITPHDGEELILQTCWPAGTNWKRLLVFAKPS